MVPLRGNLLLYCRQRHQLLIHAGLGHFIHLILTRLKAHITAETHAQKQLSTTNFAHVGMEDEPGKKSAQNETFTQTFTSLKSHTERLRASGPEGSLSGFRVWGLGFRV